MSGRWGRFSSIPSPHPLHGQTLTPSGVNRGNQGHCGQCHRGSGHHDVPAGLLARSARPPAACGCASPSSAPAPGGVRTAARHPRSTEHFPRPGLAGSAPLQAPRRSQQWSGAHRNAGSLAWRRTAKALRPCVYASPVFGDDPLPDTWHKSPCWPFPRPAQPPSFPSWVPGNPSPGSAPGKPALTASMASVSGSFLPPPSKGPPTPGLPSPRTHAEPGPHISAARQVKSVH